MKVIYTEFPEDLSDNLMIIFEQKLIINLNYNGSENLTIHVLDEINDFSDFFRC